MNNLSNLFNSIKPNVVVVAAFLGSTPLLVGKHSPAGAHQTAVWLSIIAIGLLSFVGIVETIRTARLRHRPFPAFGLVCAVLMLLTVGILITH